MQPRAPRPLPKSPIHTNLWRFIAAIVESAPDSPGVYAMWRNKQLIYYGSSASIRACLFEHLRGQRSACTREATHYSWELSDYATAREGELLSDYWSAYARFPVCNEAETIERVVKKVSA